MCYNSECLLYETQVSETHQTEVKEAIMTVRIVADSTCDLPEKVIAEHGTKVIPLYINGERENGGFSDRWRVPDASVGPCPRH